LIAWITSAYAGGPSCVRPDHESRYGVPFGDVLVGVGQPLRRGGVVAERGIDRLERRLRVADDRERALLVRVPRGGVDPDEADIRVLEHRPRSGGEVLQARAHRDDDVGLFCDGVRRARPGDAYRAGVVRVIVGQCRLAGHGLHDRDAMALGERANGLRRVRVMDAATRRSASAASPAR
jgi:hypothetical protein